MLALWKRHGRTGVGVPEDGIAHQARTELLSFEEIDRVVAVFATLERRPYANMLLTKGVLGEDGAVVRPPRPIRPPRGLRP